MKESTEKYENHWKDLKLFLEKQGDFIKNVLLRKEYIAFELVLSYMTYLESTDIEGFDSKREYHEHIDCLISILNNMKVKMK